MSQLAAPQVAETVTTIDLRDAAVRDMLLIPMRSLAENESKVDVICLPSSESVTFHVHCSSKDLGMLIGNQGRTARAARALLTAVASKNGRK